MQVEQRFWDKVEIIPFHPCWEWTGHQDKDGYGRLRANNKDLRAHRVSWEMHNKRHIPKGMQIMHSCDNPSCVNPAHLSLGTAQDNANDALSKGRTVGARLKQRTHCRYGHEYNEENTYMVMGRKRRCRICSATTAQRFRERRDGVSR